MDMNERITADPNQPLTDNPFDQDEPPHLITIDLFGDIMAHDQWVYDLLLTAVKATCGYVLRSTIERTEEDEGAWRAFFMVPHRADEQAARGWLVGELRRVQAAHAGISEIHDAHLNFGGPYNIRAIDLRWR